MGDSPKTILISGHFAGEAQERKLRYLERLDAALRADGYRLFLVSLGRGKPQTSLEHAVVPGHVHAVLAMHEHDISPIVDLPLPLDQAAAVEAQTRQISRDHAALMLTLFAAFMRDLLRDVRPALCVLWHEFNGFHYTLTHVCREIGLPFLYIEYGVLPGSINLDPGGQMAESWVARDHERFRALPIGPEDKSRAGDYLVWAREGRHTRKPQAGAVDIAPIVARARDAGRRVIFYAGQNDWGSGIIPPTLPEARTHSPFYEDTLDALRCLSEVAEQLDWHVLFKPHPMVEERHKNFEVPYPDRVDCVIGANIFDCMDQSDLTTTLFSGVSYLALIHDRPVLMLGINHLYKKGCAYEIESRSQLAEALDRAIRDGFTDDQRRNWRRHVAQLWRHYLFAFEDAVEAMMGRGVDEAARYLIDYVHQESARPINPDDLALPPVQAPPSARLRGAVIAADLPRSRLAAAAARVLPAPIFTALRTAYHRLITGDS